MVADCKSVNKDLWMRERLGDSGSVYVDCKIEMYLSSLAFA